MLPAERLFRIFLLSHKLCFGMNTQPKPARKKSSVRPCPQGCGFALHDKDQHEACPVCMGIVHARRALTEPGACGFCQPLRHSTLERRVTFVERVLGQATVARQDPLLSESRDPALSVFRFLPTEGVTRCTKNITRYSTFVCLFFNKGKAGNKSER